MFFNCGNFSEAWKDFLIGISEEPRLSRPEPWLGNAEKIHSEYMRSVAAVPYGSHFSKICASIQA